MKPWKRSRGAPERAAFSSVSSARLSITSRRFSIAFCSVKISLALG